MDRPQKQNKSSRRFRLLISGVLLAVFLLSAVKLLRIYTEYKSGIDNYVNLEQYVSVPAAVSPAKPGSEAEQTEADTKDHAPVEESFPQIDFAKLQQINPDLVAWIYCEGTPVNYPVVHTDDNEFYLKHLFDGSYNSSGCIFLDSRNEADFSDQHSIIYGHNMKNGTMFSCLIKYKEQDFFDQHPQILLMTPEQNYTLELFAGYVAATGDDAWMLEFQNEEEFAQWVERAISRSCFESLSAPAAGEQVITLSTCSYEFENARFVLLGRLCKVGQL